MSAANEPEPTALPARRAVPALPRVRPRVVLCEEDRVPHHAKPKPDADVFLPVEGRMRKSSGEASSRVSKRTAQEQCWPAWTRLCRPIFLLLSVLQFHQPRGPLRDLGHSELPHRGDLQSFLQYLMSRQLPVLWRWVPGSHLPDPLCGCRGGGVGTHPGGVRVAGDVPCPSCCPRGPEQTRRTLRETLMKWNSRDQEEWGRAEGDCSNSGHLDPLPCRVFPLQRFLIHFYLPVCSVHSSHCLPSPVLPHWKTLSSRHSIPRFLLQ
ncbi:uncharacterized protein LOC123978514 isoform X1 [Micropterus dolomieu]|uniref:uncharacterized protein LOC123978514 isoform X1 n=1 Tax=Micropterus dolomieu TaxID=147949 RepID=UPI001E8DAC65|nr:uncharacterized protein LOC123978514 isoform X1 [Micropterus dolomieu]